MILKKCRIFKFNIKESKKFTVRNLPRSGGVEPTGEKYFPPEEMKKIQIMKIVPLETS